MAEMTRDLATFVVDAGIGFTALAQDVFLDKRPPTPDKAVWLTDTGAASAFSGLPDLARTVQVTVRAKGVQAAKTAAWAIHALFFPDGVGRHISQGGKVYLTVPTASATPTPIGEDSQGRQEYVLNMVVVATPD